MTDSSYFHHQNEIARGIAQRRGYPEAWCQVNRVYKPAHLPWSRIVFGYGEPEEESRIVKGGTLNPWFLDDLIYEERYIRFLCAFNGYAQPDIWQQGKKIAINMPWMGYPVAVAGELNPQLLELFPGESFAEVINPLLIVEANRLLAKGCRQTDLWQDRGPNNIGVNPFYKKRTSKNSATQEKEIKVSFMDAESLEHAGDEKTIRAFKNNIVRVCDWITKKSETKQAPKGLFRIF